MAEFSTSEAHSSPCQPLNDTPTSEPIYRITEAQPSFLQVLEYEKDQYGFYPPKRTRIALTLWPDPTSTAVTGSNKIENINFQLVLGPYHATARAETSKPRGGQRSRRRFSDAGLEPLS